MKFDPTNVPEGQELFQACIEICSVRELDDRLFSEGTSFKDAWDQFKEIYPEAEQIFVWKYSKDFGKGKAR